MLFHCLLADDEGEVDVVATVMDVGIEIVGHQEAVGILAVGVLPCGGVPFRDLHVVVDFARPPCEACRSGRVADGHCEHPNCTPDGCRL